MVGRFVQQQQIRAEGKRARNRRAPPLAAAGGLRVAAHVDAELPGDIFDIMRFGRAGAGHGVIHQRGEPGHGWVLFQHDDIGVGPRLAQPPVAFDLARDQFEQRGFARAIAPDQRDPVTRADMQVHAGAGQAAEQPAAALLQAEAFPRENWRISHKSGAPRLARR